MRTCATTPRLARRPRARLGRSLRSPLPTDGAARRSRRRYDLSSDDSLGQPTVHLALGITFSTAPGADPAITSIVADVIWMGEGAAPETEGLAFESSPLHSIYTCATWHGARPRAAHPSRR